MYVIHPYFADAFLQTVAPEHQPHLNKKGASLLLIGNPYHYGCIIGRVAKPYFTAGNYLLCPAGALLYLPTPAVQAARHKSFVQCAGRLPPALFRQCAENCATLRNRRYKGLGAVLLPTVLAVLECPTAGSGRIAGRLRYGVELCIKLNADNGLLNGNLKFIVRVQPVPIFNLTFATVRTPF